MRRPHDVKMDRIKELYEQMIQTLREDSIFRNEIFSELITYQKEDGSFSVIDDYRCDGDIRVAYVYYPTYYATAAIMYMANMDGMTDKMRNALEKGLKFAMGRRLAGHGVSATEEQIEALNIYKTAGLYEWLSNHKKQFEAFDQLIGTIIEKYRECIRTGNVMHDWMVDFTESFQKEIDEYDDAMQEYIWYASYGSNISYGRFMEYIAECSDTSQPIDAKPVTIPFGIYFAYKSRPLGKKRRRIP